MRLTSFATRQPVTIAMATLAIVLLGWISFRELGTDLLPNLDTPVITVDLRAPGKSSQEMEERYSRSLERDINTLAGVDRVYSVTRPGQSVVVATFSWDTDMAFALLEIQKRTGPYAVDPDVDTLDVVQEDPQALPIARIAVTSSDGDTDPDALLGIVESLVKPKLEALEGVASAQIEGDGEKEIRIELDPYMLEAFDLAASDIVTRIQQANQDVSGGTIEDEGRSFQVKGMARIQTAADIASLIVGERETGGGQTASSAAPSGGASAGAAASEAGRRIPVRLGEVATVSLAVQERQTIVRLDGVECVGIALYKEADASTVDVMEIALEAVNGLDLDLADVSFTTVENQAKFIENAVREVEEAALYGAVLAVIVLLVFLRSWTVTLVIGLAIPISILATFTLMYFQNLTLNIMTLGGLALGAGMLVDNAIIVIENIFRHAERGEDPATAASRGAGEVGTAILASTLTTISVFVPIVYLRGLVGELFKEQAWTVTFSLMSSLVVALTVVPALSARLLHKAKGRPAGGERFGRFLHGVLRHRAIAAVLAVTILGGAGYLAVNIPSEFIPGDDQGLLHIDIALPESTRIEVTDRVAGRVREIASEVGQDDIATLYSRSGIDPTRVASAGDPTGPNRATVSVSLRPEAEISLAGMVEHMDPHLSAIPDLEITYRLHTTALEGVMGAQVAPIEIDVVGDDLDELRRLTDEVATRIAELPSIYNITTNFQGGRPEVDLALKPQIAAAFGLTPQALAETIEQRLAGSVAGELSRNQRARTIRVAYEKIDLRELEAMRIETADGAVLTLGDVAEPRIVEGPREILRDRQRRIGRISGYLVDGAVLGDAAAEVEVLLDQVALPPGYQAHLGGQEQQREESFAGLGFALGLSVLLVYMVMASLFESIVHPLTVMLTVPLAGVGVVAAFWVLGEPLSVMAFIGVIMLAGIAVNDAIILVDHINQLRVGAESLRDAVVRAAQDRLRPILMTSATTILALLPMANGVGEGAQLRAPMAIAVISGLVTSTLMTLIFIPVAYELIDRVRPARVRAAASSRYTDLDD
ncbi:MAG: MMPL family transporter [Acidobacteria bacterium]|nr:MMPL family transporter [Acidobacteriota bacterium]